MNWGFRTYYRLAPPVCQPGVGVDLSPSQSQRALLAFTVGNSFFRSKHSRLVWRRFFWGSKEGVTPIILDIIARAQGPIFPLF